MWHHVGNDCGIMAWDHGKWDMEHGYCGASLLDMQCTNTFAFPSTSWLQAPFLSLGALFFTVGFGICVDS